MPKEDLPLKWRLFEKMPLGDHRRECLVCCAPEMQKLLWDQENLRWKKERTAKEMSDKRRADKRRKVVEQPNRSWRDAVCREIE